MDELKKEIGKRIKQCRKEKGMTQKELAREVGCHEVTIRQYENGLRSPKLVSQYAIARALSVPYESLFTLSAPCAQLGTNLAEVGTDCISRQAAIDAEGLDVEIRCEMCTNPMHTDRGCDGHCKYDEKLYERIMQILDERIKPLPSAQPEIIYCKDCVKHNKGLGNYEVHPDGSGTWIWKDSACPLVSWRDKAQGHEFDYQFCAYAERREVTK